MLPLPELNFRRTPVVLITTAIAAALETACTLQSLFAGPGQRTLRHALYTENRLGLLSPVWSGELWRPVTTSLLHGFLLHAVFNIYWMLVFGGTLERRFGTWRLLGLLVLLANLSMMSQFVFSNRDVADLGAQHSVVGLSGVMYGLFGILLIGRRYEERLYEACNDQTALLMGAWFVFCIFADRFELLPVANVAHAVGLVFGLLYGATIFDRPRRWLWFIPSLIATLLVLSTLFYVPNNDLYEQYQRRQQQIGEYEKIQQILQDAIDNADGEAE